MNGGENTSSGALTGKTDTVYVTREVLSKPVEILDTVYLMREQSPQPVRTSKTNNTIITDTNGYLPAPSDIRVLSVDEINGISNQERGSSIKDDTLIKKFSFVGLL